jgi:SWI/SNF-related matrix-associated actin-dependent regulator 1 of chromatin subfamily A
MFRNRYKGVCNNPECKAEVLPQNGYTEKSNNKWIVWCESCRPQKTNESNESVVARLTNEGKIYINYDPDSIALIRTLPCAYFNGREKCWEASLEPEHRQRLLEVADYLKLEVDESLRVIEQSEQAKTAELMGLYDYQIEGVNFLSKKTKAILGDEMGLGKSLQSLMTIPKNGRAMVICRAGLKYNWLDEVQKWRKDLSPCVISGKGNFRWPNSGEVIIINNDILPTSFDPPKKAEGSKAAATREFRNQLKINNPESQNTILIIDEAHDYKNWKAARTRKVKEIALLAKKVYGLTGSPLNNRPEDLYGVLETLGLAKEAFKSWDNYQKLFGAYVQTFLAHGRTVRKICWGKPSPVVPELLKRVMLRRLRSNVLPQLPEKTYTNLVVGDIDAKLKKQLDKMWKDWDTKLDVKDELPPFHRFSEIREKLARNRIPALIEYIENAEEQEVPLVVFSAHLAPLDPLLFRDGWAVISGVCSPEKRQEIVREFQAGKLKGLGVSIQAGGIGINLTHAWKGIFVDLDWSPAANWQAEDRLARIGQKSNKVEIVRMVSDHPLDLHLQKMLVNKMDTIFRAVDKTITGQGLNIDNVQNVLV